MKLIHAITAAALLTLSAAAVAPAARADDDAKINARISSPAGPLLARTALR